MQNDDDMPAVVAPTTARTGQTAWWFPVLGVIAVAALGISLASVVLSGADKVDTSEGTLTTGVATSFEVSLTEFSISPAAIEVPAGQELTFKVTNAGTMAHDFSVGGTKGTKRLEAGQSETIKVPGVTASTQAWCTIPGHKESGMVMQITVAGSGATGAAAADASAGTAAATIDPNAVPGAGWKARDPLLAPVEGGTEHKITLHATETELEVAPGVKQAMWTFNDTVPGPTLHGRVGDVFTVTLVNDGKVAHSIDFHASQVAMDTKMRSIEPGESLVYQFKAEHSGIWMYHCGTAPVLHHIGNGMYGAVVIDPPDLAPVAHEYAFVQSDMYPTADGSLATLDQMLGERWSVIAFNGYFNQYKFEPITSAKPGERVRIWVLDAGPSENTAFHIVGTQFDTVFKEGAYLLRPDNPESGGSQTLDLQPSQGGFVEFAFAEDGTYAMVTHKFASASKGAVAIWHVGNVPTPPTGSAAGH